MTPTNQERFSLWEKPSDVAPALRSWTYPGENFGHEFAYPRDIAEQLARANQQPVPAAAGSQVAEAKPPQPPEEKAPAAAPPPQPAPQPEPQPAPQETAPQPAPPPQPEAQPQPQPMPATASYQPVLAAAGLMSLAIAVSLRRARRFS